MSRSRGKPSEKNASRASSGVATRWRSDLVALALSMARGCLPAQRVAAGSPPEGGREAISTPAAALCVSRYFWTITPPMECPTTTGVASKPRTIWSRSAT